MNLGKAKLKAIVTFCDQSGHDHPLYRTYIIFIPTFDQSL